MDTNILLENQKDRDLGVDEKKILKLILKKQTARTDQLVQDRIQWRAVVNLHVQP
jgi:hypothetical protein